jgi:hypothetical protein
VYVSKNTNKNDNKSEDEGEGEDEDEDEEVVSYTLVPPNNKQVRYDGYGETRYSPDYFYAQYNKNVRKKDIKYMMEEQLESLDVFYL